MNDDLNNTDTDVEMSDQEYANDSVSMSAGSMEAHRRLRDNMASDVEAFLAGGGQIQQIEPNVMADPPRKPQSNYGSRPI